jgi:tRNA pseudouridine synthase 8/2,5-diamino-6-(5-phospho-D-ribitylamino)-pyrimidin-4(3H)-one deaminase
MSIGEAGPGPSSTLKVRAEEDIQLRREAPYWHVYRTFAKERWVGRKLLEVMVTDFRDRSAEYYQWAIHKGFCNVNGQKRSGDYVIKQGDQLQNRVHRHEPAVTAEPIRVIYRDDEEGRLVIVKPGSIPVHAAGRYNKLTLQELLQKDLKIRKIYTSNRLDRLTSGIMVCSTKKHTAHALCESFALGKVKKAYVCRVRGKFPEEELVCKEPLLQCDRQTGFSVIHPIGKESETIFNRLSYDSVTDTSAVYCRPITGRTHQIRAHVQYLGYPIPNDPIYGHRIWKQYPPKMFKDLPLKLERWKVEPECSLSVYGSPEVDEVAAGLKIDRDEKEDWSRWKDEIMFKSMLEKEGFEWQSSKSATKGSALGGKTRRARRQPILPRMQDSIGARCRGPRRSLHLPSRNQISDGRLVL